MGEASIPAGEDYFDIVPQGNAGGINACEDSFAMGQYQNLDDKTKISMPPFEKMKSGLDFSVRSIGVPYTGSAVIRYGRMLGYETRYKEHTDGVVRMIKAGKKAQIAAVNPAYLMKMQKAVGKTYHKSPSVRPVTDFAKSIKIKEQKFTVVKTEVTNGKFIRVSEDVSYARAMQIKAKQEEDVLLVSTAKAS
jgi:hypothetical protein